MVYILLAVLCCGGDDWKEWVGEEPPVDIAFVLLDNKECKLVQWELTRSSALAPFCKLQFVSAYNAPALAGLSPCMKFGAESWEKLPVITGVEYELGDWHRWLAYRLGQHFKYRCYINHRQHLLDREDRHPDVPYRRSRFYWRSTRGINLTVEDYECCLMSELRLYQHFFRHLTDHRVVGITIDDSGQFYWTTKGGFDRHKGTRYEMPVEAPGKDVLRLPKNPFRFVNVKSED